MTSNTSITPPPSRNSSKSARSKKKNDETASPKTNRLFIIFAILCTIVAFANIQFHHQFHDEHVTTKSQKEFSELHFQTSREQQEDNYRKKIQRAEQKYGTLKNKESKQVTSSILNASISNANKNDGEQHKLAGLNCIEKYGGPEDDYAEKEMAFWSDIPSDASYKSPFMGADGGEGGEDEKFLTFEP